ncbi:hypothetical protein GCM10023086_36180 [Streptomyces venetus]|uniref:Uncharacterized protein n=1 Tax=Streptomyces venetus TaxID=1701086 RepID=A0ABP8G0E0_9ACTN
MTILVSTLGKVVRGEENAFNRFIGEGQLLAILDQIAGVELEATRVALRQFDLNRDKQSATWSIINHLESASAALAAVHTPESFKRRWLGSGMDRLNALSRDFTVRMLLCSLLFSLGEKERSLAWLQRLEELILHYYPVKDLTVEPELRNVSIKGFLNYQSLAAGSYLHPIRGATLSISDAIRDLQGKGEDFVSIDTALEFVLMARPIVSE